MSDNYIENTFPWCSFKRFSETFENVINFRGFTVETQACSQRKGHLSETMIPFRGLEVDGVMCGEQKDLGVGLVFRPR